MGIRSQSSQQFVKTEILHREPELDRPDAEAAQQMRLPYAGRANDILPAFPDLRFGFGIRFTHGLVSLFKLSPGQSRVGLRI